MMFALLTLCACAYVVLVSGHGFLKEPPSRNSMWREDFNTPKNYNDMGLNCGGASYQWDKMGGKCGICGDPYDANPGDHVVGGKYVHVNRPLSRCYNTIDNFIDVTLRITAYHRGYFEFYLCENNNMAADPSIDCFENGHVLTIAGSNGETRYSIQDVKEESYSYQLNIPKGVTCTQCILRWKYNAGNSYGCDETGCGQGLGAQEQFINCADIAIVDDCTGQATDGPIVTDRNTDRPQTNGETNAWTDPWSTQPKATYPNTILTTVFTTLYPVRYPPNTRCRGVGAWEGDSSMDGWCMQNCFHSPPYCPQEYCECEVDDDDDGLMGEDDD